MKKYLLVLGAMLLFMGQALAGDKNSGLSVKVHMMQDGVMRQNGKMMVQKDGKAMAMESDVSMRNGTLVMRDGTCLLKDRSQIKLMEGDRMDTNGNMIRLKKTPKK